MPEEVTLYEIAHLAIQIDADPTKLLDNLHLISQIKHLSPSAESGQEVFDRILTYCEIQYSSGLANDELLQRVSIWSSQKDFEISPDWAEGTEPNTRLRREKLVSTLGLDLEQIEIFNRIFPVFLEGNILIAPFHTPWYTASRKMEGAFYGPSILSYLKTRGFEEKSLALIDQASDQILDYLGDPKSDEIYSSRGLVVGYVQSGKTTNINVLVAKAIDAGFRLVIILAGLTDVLRAQTQRRIDKEVVGKVLINSDPEETQNDGYVFHADWEDFIVHSPLAGMPAGPPIERLTTRRFDFANTRNANLFSDGWAKNDISARIVVIKKNTTRLKALTRSLKNLSTDIRTTLPVLVIDDESDQASVNTINPSKSSAEERNRSSINYEVTNLLKMLSRSQYVGYTATPFANVLIDPDDEHDLFPKDFVYSLAQPIGYMGVKDFYDLDDEFMAVNDLPELESNKARHVRDVYPASEDDVAERLMHAVDTYVLAGALKLYRRDRGIGKFRHHTMFYTDSPLRQQHKEARQSIQEIWETSQHNSPVGLNRLRQIFENDLVKFSQHRDDLDYFPANFDGIREYISRARQKIDKTFNGHSVVLVVNSDDLSTSPDFEMEEIWKIIVGGAKLSRGYTIEGLTTTFFRRTSTAQATLLQMGRWFGYRHGYQDLVRLYISRKEKVGRKVLDLYEAFEAICRDEEALRRELRMYSRVQPGGNRLTPREIPPLIQNSHPMLKPDQRNKMWNATLMSRNFGSQRKMFGSASIEAETLRRNVELFETIITQHPLVLQDFGHERPNPMMVSKVPHKRMLDFLLGFSRPNPTPEHELFVQFLRHERHEIADWLIVMPQLSNVDTWEMSTGDVVSVVRRRYDRDKESFTTIGEDRHRAPCYQIARIETTSDPGAVSDVVSAYARTDGLAVLLTYPMTPKSSPEDTGSIVLDPQTPALGLEYFIPPNSIPLAKFGARRSDAPDKVVVDARDVLDGS